jgi:hypothetical protein
MILLWGLSGDRPFDSVRAALTSRVHAVVDQRRHAEITLDLTYAGEVTGSICLGSERIDLEAVHAVYWRPYDITRVPAVTGGGPGALQAAWAVEDAIGGWLELTSARVVNRPSAMASNSSKPFQQEILRAQGFPVPATLVTTDPDAVRSFWTDNGCVIYKSVSGTRSVVSRLTQQHVDRLDHVVSCPTQFQRYVPGRDVRVHVVGSEVFATEVISDADDYRYAGQSGIPAQLRPARIPDEVAERCVRVTSTLGLEFSGVDLRHTPDDRWFAFEVNPSPGFTYYQAHTGQPIAEAVAAHLGRRQS